MEKIWRTGVPLEDYADTKPCHGVLTGFNEAFLIDTSTRDALLSADPKCELIIKPYLRGQNVKRWHVPWAGQGMIFARRRIDIDSYPSVLAHLENFRESLGPRPRDWTGDPKAWKGRKPGSYRWFEIQNSIEYRS